MILSEDTIVDGLGFKLLLQRLANSFVLAAKPQENLPVSREQQVNEYKYGSFRKLGYLILGSLS